MKDYLTAQEVADILDISVPTVYSYVSRGLLSSENVASDHRIKRYRGSDVEHLLKRREAQRQPEDFAKSTLHRGMPVLDSGISLIRDGRLYYRGHEVVKLAQNHTIEQVSGLLWLDELDGSLFTFKSKLQLPPELWHWREFPAFTRMQMMLPLAATQDRAGTVLHPEHVPLTGARILRLLTGAVVGHFEKPTIAENILSVWHSLHPYNQQALDAALILCADHGLNASSFAARIAAGTHADPYAVVSAGLATLSGTRQGGMGQRVRSFLNCIKRPEDAERIVEERLDKREDIPGCDHPMYPNGDPRGKLLVKLARQYAVDKAALEYHLAVLEAVDQISGQKPSVDWGLVMLSDVLTLPEDAPILLFALGRTVGWLGHAIEQYESGGMIRPTARYTGPDPAEM
ncbi:MAG: citrate synthase family protein [Chloroflexi bacterium]|nr:citrate synthase family protein [Chloroflexota bacterium]